MTATRSNTYSNALGNPSVVRYKSNVRSIEHQFDVAPALGRRRSRTVSTLVADPQLVEPPLVDPVQRLSSSSSALRVPAPARAPRRPVQLRGPRTRPIRAVPAPSLASSPSVPPRSCLVGAAEPTPGWRLTERGIALVLVVGLMLVVAALTVIGLTALRVTSPGYQVPGHQITTVTPDRAASTSA